MIEIKEVGFADIIEVSDAIPEWDQKYDVSYYQDRCDGRDTLVTIGYIDGKKAGYLVSYDRDQDGSFYCWMAGVMPNFRGKGVLKSMMQYHKSWAKDKEYDVLRIKTRNNRREMLSFLVKYGFNFIDVVEYEEVKDNRIIAEIVL